MNIAEIFSDPYLRRVVLRAAVVGLLVSMSAAVLGVRLVVKRYAMLGDGLSHIGFCAVAFATLIGLADFSLVVSVPLVILAAVFLLKIGENGKIKGDSAVALLSTGAVALGYLIYHFSGRSAADVCGSLFGSSSVITVTTADLVFSVILAAGVGCFLLFSYNKMFAICFDEPFCAAAGLRTGGYNFLFAALSGVTVVVGMKLIGAVLISALVVFPAVTAMRVCGTFRGTVVCSVAVSAGCFLAGYAVSCAASLPVGPAVVLANAAALGVFALIGSLRRRAGR